jgi:hypothetical protein
MADTMSPHFLNTVAGPQLYFAALNVLALWRERMRLAKGHPFRADKDVQRVHWMLSGLLLLAQPSA